MTKRCLYSDFTVMADYETITTTTVACPATAIPAVAGVSGVAALTTGVLPIGVGHGRVKVRDVGDIGDVAAPTSINTVAIPPYASAFQPAQISSVCLCLVGVPTTATTHQLATVTSFANVSLLRIGSCLKRSVNTFISRRFLRQRL